MFSRGLLAVKLVVLVIGFARCEPIVETEYLKQPQLGRVAADAESTTEPLLTDHVEKHAQPVDYERPLTAPAHGMDAESAEDKPLPVDTNDKEDTQRHSVKREEFDVGYSEQKGSEHAEDKLLTVNVHDQQETQRKEEESSQDVSEQNDAELAEDNPLTVNVNDQDDTQREEDEDIARLKKIFQKDNISAGEAIDMEAVEETSDDEGKPHPPQASRHIIAKHNVVSEETTNMESKPKHARRPRPVVTVNHARSKRTVTIVNQDSATGNPKHHATGRGKMIRREKKEVESIDKQENQEPPPPNYKCGCRKLEEGEPLQWYTYDLPPAYNDDLLESYGTVAAERLSNSGAGASFKIPGSGIEAHMTYQFNMDIIVDHRLRGEVQNGTSGRSSDPCQAHVFYVPYMMHLQFGQYFPGVLNGPAMNGTRPGINKFDSFMRNSGVFQHFGKCPHVLFIPRPPRQIFSNVIRSDGSYFFETAVNNSNFFFYTIEPFAPGHGEAAHNIEAGRTRLWRRERIAPYPSMFHPCSGDDLAKQQQWALTAKRQARVVYYGDTTKLVSRRFIKAWCDKHKMTGNVTGTKATPDMAGCNMMTCVHGFNHTQEQSPQFFQDIVQTYHGGDFCLHPTGDTVTRKGVWDGAAAGCIPVVFGWNNLKNGDIDLRAQLKQWDLHDDFIFAEEYELNGLDLLGTLLAMNDTEIQERRRRMVAKMGRLVYRTADCPVSEYEDALDFSLRAAAKSTLAGT